MDIQEYFNEFMQDIYARSGVSEESDSIVFTERMCDFLVDEAIIDEYAVIGYKKDNLGIKVDAWQFNDNLEILRLFFSDYRSEKELQTLTQTDIDTNFRKLERFLSKSLKPNFKQSMEESDPAFGLAHAVFANAENISKVQLIILTNAQLSTRVQSMEEKGVEGFYCTYDIWDLSRLYRIESSGKAREDIIVDFKEYFPDGIPCLSAYTGTRDYESYLLAVPGDLIADLYDQFGERLLEQNVRTFLQFRGNVNKGLRNTILNEPFMFFAYNNGLTATAESVDFQDGNSNIFSVKNLQIVNGGQTMASIFTAKKKNKADLSNVYVQMKLSIIPEDYVDIVVPKISEYANTQNKVNAAAFFSNHPYHLRIESYSRRLWAPSPEGSLRESRWFYERVRGQYANAQANLTRSQQKQFLAKNPRSQMFTKTDLAKYILTFDMLPQVVSRGAQKCFAWFANDISRDWDKNEEKFNQLYFKRLIAKAIIFKFVDKSILKQPWYGGGYKANIVTYGIAKLMSMVSMTDKCLDLAKIWNQQRLSKALEEQLLEIAENVYYEIQNTPQEITNVTEWCKRDGCWHRIKDVPLPINRSLENELIDKEEIEYIEKNAITSQKIDNGINVQSYVVEKGAAYWKQVREWNNVKQILSPMEVSILNISCSIPTKIPSEKQCKIVVKFEKRVLEEGFPSI